jgi:hypothetical protein
LPSHFQSIGFIVEDRDDLSDLVDLVAPLTHRIPVPGGAYAVWADTSGAELWLQVNDDNAVINMHPHWGGSARLPIDVERWWRSTGSHLDGRFVGTAGPERVPLVVDAPNASLYKDKPPRGQVDAQIAAFAHSLDVWADESEFQQSQSESEVQFAPQSFSPSGMFMNSPDGATEMIPAATAWFTGEVIATDVLRNTASDVEYLWIQVETLGGTFDVVADPSLLAGKASPQIGGIVQGDFWLSGSWESRHSARMARRYLNRT